MGFGHRRDVFGTKQRKTETRIRQILFERREYRMKAAEVERVYFAFGSFAYFCCQKYKSNYEIVIYQDTVLQQYDEQERTKIPYLSMGIFREYFIQHLEREHELSVLQ